MPPERPVLPVHASDRPPPSPGRQPPEHDPDEPPPVEEPPSPIPIPPDLPPEPLRAGGLAIAAALPSPGARLR